MFLVRVGRKRHSGGVWRVGRMRLPSCGSCTSPSSRGLAPRPVGRADRWACNQCPPSGTPAQLLQPLGWGACLALGGRAPASAGHLLHRSRWGQERHSVSCRLRCSLKSSHLSLRWGPRLWPPTLYVALPFGPLPWGRSLQHQTRGSDLPGAWR